MGSFENWHAWNYNFRVAIVHSFYSSRSPSGENVVVQQHADALRRAGYAVEIFAQRTDDRENRRTYPLEAAATVATGVGPSPHGLADFDPDIIHVHNLFPNYGKTWLKNAPAPVVTTLHNYRPLCSAGTFFRDGGPCTDCLDKRSSAPAVQYGCYRGRVQSVPVALGQRFDRDRALVDASAIIVLSEQMRGLYGNAGVPDAKMQTLPHFLPSALDSGPGDGGDYWLYAGRLTAEKGALSLVEEWPQGRQLLIAGEGDLETEIRSAASGKDVQMLGRVERAELLDLMRGARGLVFPSRWFEGFGLVYMEAIAAGTPVLAWKPSVVASFIETDGTGLVGSEDLEETLDTATRLFPALRKHCRAMFEDSYTERAWVGSLRRIYGTAIRESGK